MIESYIYEQKGFKPLLIREGWQVSQLNHIEKHGLEDIDQIERHHHTDEVFILHKGSAVLIEAELKDTDVYFNCVCMKQGVIYNIPAGVWHDIAMDTDAHIIIVEKSNTHISDCEYFPLSKKQRLALYSDIKHQILL